MLEVSNCELRYLEGTYAAVGMFNGTTMYRKEARDGRAHLLLYGGVGCYTWCFVKEAASLLPKISAGDIILGNISRGREPPESGWERLIFKSVSIQFRKSTNTQVRAAVDQNPAWGSFAPACRQAQRANSSQEGEASLRRELAECKASKEELRQQLVDMRVARATELKARAWALIAPMPWPSHYTEFRVDRLQDNDPVHILLSMLFCDSCVQHREKLHSGKFSPAPQLLVHSIDVVVNPRLVKQYFTKAEEIEGLRRNGCSSITPLAHLKVPPRKGSAPLSPDLNEHLVFHGATSDVVKTICRGGFDPRRGGEGVGKMFGVASYFAVNASKSDIYTEDFTQRLPRRAERQIIVARALLGESYRTTNVMKNSTRPPDGDDDLPLDSVWAATRHDGRVVDHHEVMIYDKYQAIPDAVITYTHKQSCECAECAKRPGS